MGYHIHYSCGMVVIMRRDELFAKFGPILLEAICLCILDEVNRIRTHVNMPLITKQDVLDELNNHLGELEPYEWMSGDQLWH